MDKKSLLLLFLLALSSLALAQQTGKNKDDKESLAFKKKNWYLTFYRLYIPDYSYKFQESFYLVQKANSGDPFAQHELGIRYLTGDGFETDTLKCIYWIKRAAEQDLPSACYNLAIFYYNGWKDVWNPFEAYKNFRKAANNGMTEAEFAVGVSFTENLVMPKNIDSAFVWIKRSAGKGFSPAIDALRRLRENYLELNISADSSRPGQKKIMYMQDSTILKSRSGSTAQVPPLEFMDYGKDSSVVPTDSAYFIRLVKNSNLETKDQIGLAGVDSVELLKPAEILRYINISANSGSPDANLFLGRFYEKGIFVKRSPARALVYYLRAYRLESPLAPVFINKLIDQKPVMDEVYRLAGTKNPDGLFVFSTLNSMGYNSLLTPEKLVKYLEEAAAKKHIPSMLELGQCYFSGGAVKGDTVKAFQYWQMAADNGSSEGLLRIAMAQLVLTGKCSSVISASQLRDADTLGSTLAQTILGYQYEQGYDVPRDWKTAIKYYRKAAYRGSIAAFVSIKRMYDSLRPDGRFFELKAGN